MKFPSRSIFVLIASFSICSAQAADDVTFLEGLPGTNQDFANDVSNDGSVVVGRSNFRPVMWTLADGITDLGSLGGGDDGTAHAVNGDGTVVVGESISANGREAFRWTQATGMVGLGDLDGGSFSSKAYGVNVDGSVVVGMGSSSSGSEAFRWTQSTGMVGLGDLPGGSFFSRARAVSADGSVVVGFANSSSGGEAFRWTQSTGMIGLGVLPGAGYQSEAWGVSADGSVIVGASTTTSGTEAFRWTQATGMVGLGYLPGGYFSSIARSVSADGSVIVGGSRTATSISEAFRWTEATGMQSVADWLMGAGVSTAGMTLTQANGVNADGSVVVGSGNAGGGQEAWIARVGYVPPSATAPVSGLITFSDLLVSLNSASVLLQAGKAMTSLPFYGAHHKPLMTFRGLSKQCLWASGDLASYDHRYDGDGGLAELGTCYDFIPNKFRVGVGLGKIYLDADTTFSGNTDLDGEYFVLEMNYLTDQLPLLFSLTTVLGDYDADVKRGYRNGATLDASKGDTDVESRALRLRADWLNAFQFNGINFTPRVSYTVSRVEYDDYTERGGAFPAMFDDRKDTSHEIRYGVDGEYNYSKATVLRGKVEGIHRLDNSESDLKGAVLGITDFSLPGEKTKENWMRVGGEIDHYFTKGFVVSASVNGSTSGDDPEISGGITAIVSF